MALHPIIEVSWRLNLILGFLHGRKSRVAGRFVKLHWLIYLGRQDRASHILLLGTQLLLNRTRLVVRPVSLQDVLEELTLQVPERELGLISGCMR